MSSAGGRTVTVSLAANVDSYIAAMRRAKDATTSLVSETSKASQTQGWRDTSTALLAVGAAAAATVGVVSKAAITWQSDWAGVQKTVDGTTQQMDALESSLRTMATTMPATHTEIAAVAEAAGQLGVATTDVAKFSAVMIQLGETTNLSADTAATSIAQFTNIMGTGASEVDRLGAALVQLGNNGASTEAEIMAMAQRLAGVGNQMNMSTPDVLGMANAMASVGVEAEAGGSAMTLTLKGIDAAVRSGGKELATYAATAGMSAQEFAQAWGQDAASATASFVEGLGRIKGEGGDVNAVLGELGINGVRQTDTLIRLAGATKAAGAETDLLRDSLQMGADAYSQNSALTDEYGKRVETAAAQIQIAWNSIKDAAISAGESSLPAVAGLASVVASAAQAFGDLPPAVHTGGLALTAIVGVGALAAGGIMKAVTAVSSFNAAMAGLPTWASAGVGALGRLGAAAALTAAGMAVLNAAGSGLQGRMDEARMSTEGMADALRTASSDMTDINKTFAGALAGTGMVDADAADALKMYGDYAGTATHKVEDFIMGLVGMKGNVSMVGEELAKVDTALLSMSRDDAAAGFRVLQSAAKESGADINVVAESLDGYRNSLLASAQAVGVTNLSGSELQGWMAGTEPKAVSLAKVLADLGMVHSSAGASAESQAAALRTLMDAQTTAANAALAASSAMIGYNQAIASAAQVAESGSAAVLDMGAAFDLSTESGRAAQGALDGIASSALRARDEMLTNGASAQEAAGHTQAARDAFVDAAAAMGMSADAANRLADTYGLIPATVTTDVSAPGATQSQSEADAFYSALMKLPPETWTQVLSAFNSGGVDAAYAALAAIDGRTATTYIQTINRVAYENADYNPYIPGGVTRAGGGSVWGPGTATSDSIPTWLSNGEFVIRTAAAERIGYDRLAWINATGTMPGYAAGGRVALPDRLPQTVLTPATQRPVADSVVQQPAADRPVQVEVYLDGRQLAAGIRTYNRGLG